MHTHFRISFLWVQFNIIEVDDIRFEWNILSLLKIWEFVYLSILILFQIGNEFNDIENSLLS